MSKAKRPFLAGINLLFCASLGGLSCVSQAEVSTNNAFKVDRIRIQPNLIFDETAPDTIPIHRFANRFHVVTQPWTIRERLNFSEGDTITQADLTEAEAILRAQRYLRDAKVRVSPSNNNKSNQTVTVETWDKWAIMPIISVGRKGGKNRSALGVNHDNLFGLGIRSRIQYKKDEQRSGYQVALSSAFHLVPHANISLNLSDNDDGVSQQLVFDKPFYHLNTQNRYYLELLNDSRVDDIDQNGELRNSFDVDHQRFSAAFGWRLFANEFHAGRLTVGVTDEKYTFDTNIIRPLSDSAFLPEDRAYQYPWLAVEYIQRDIKVMNNVFFIRQNEDINLGWRWYAQLGIELNDVADDKKLGYHLTANLDKGYLWGESLYLFNLRSSAILNTLGGDFVQLDMHNQFFFPTNDWLTLYTRFSGSFSNTDFRDKPTVLDDATGVRGYPLQYQHGDNRISASFEARIYTDYDLYKFFNVGFAVFADVGRAYNGEFSELNEDKGTLSSVGIGTRLFSNRVSSTGVIHIDLATPLTKGNNVDSWEWRLQLHRAF